MKKWLKRTAIVTALLMIVVAFAACGLSVKGEKISEEDFAKVTATSTAALSEGFTYEMEASGKENGVKVSTTMKTAVDKDGNTMMSISMKAGSKSYKATGYTKVTEDDMISVFKYDGKWRGLSMKEMMGGDLFGAGLRLAESDYDTSPSLPAQGLLYLAELEFGDLEYKNGVYNVKADVLAEMADEDEEYSKMYFAFKGGKYIGFGYKLSDDTSSEEMVEKLSYSAKVKVPSYKDSTLEEYTEYQKEMKEKQDAVSKVVKEAA